MTTGLLYFYLRGSCGKTACHQHTLLNLFCKVPGIYYRNEKYLLRIVLSTIVVDS